MNRISVSRVSINNASEIKPSLPQAPPEVCPLCGGSGWMAVSAGPGAQIGMIKDRRVTRCDCQLEARKQTLLSAARIPKRYEHCELAHYDTDFPGASPSLAEAHFMASAFAEKYDVFAQGREVPLAKFGGDAHLAGLRSTVQRVTRGRPVWIVVAAVSELLSFVGYVALFRAVFVRAEDSSPAPTDQSSTPCTTGSSLVPHSSAARSLEATSPVERCW